MERAIQKTEKDVTLLQKMADTCREGKQKAYYQRCLQNARQVLANFREIERIVQNRGGQQNH